MRIISGKYKGKKLYLPKDNLTRPLKDLTKESLFNIISHSSLFNFKLDNTIILDLFSGIGTFGLECLSRNAKKVYFIENHINAISILKKNIGLLEMEKRSSILKNNLYDTKILKNIKKKFDIIFIYPPYKDKKISILINLILKNNLLKTDGIIIIHRHKKDIERFPDNFKILREEIYGLSKIIFGK